MVEESPPCPSWQYLLFSFLFFSFLILLPPISFGAKQFVKRIGEQLRQPTFAVSLQKNYSVLSPSGRNADNDSPVREK